MDWVNRIQNIVNKIRNQLFLRRIDSMNKIKIAMDKFDRDNSGTLDYDQFNNFCSYLGVFLSKQQLRVLYDKYDKNHGYFLLQDNALNYIQLINMIKQKVSMPRYQDIDLAWQKICGDKLARINLEQLISKYNPMKHPHVITRRKSPKEIMQSFAQAIREHSADKQSITYQQFCQYYIDLSIFNPNQREQVHINNSFTMILFGTHGICMILEYLRKDYKNYKQKTFVYEDEEKTCKKAFYYFDLNNLNMVDFQNFRRGADKFGCNFSEKQMRTMFDRFDQDRSGFLDYGEFSKIFLGIGVKPMQFILHPTRTFKSLK